MPNPVEFDITVGALPEGFDTDPQGMLEAFAARLFITPSVPWSSFTLGAAQPTSDLGPWFKNGQEVYVWDDGLATYIPQVIDDVALGYVVASLDPGASGYKLWFDTTAGAVKWSNGAVWADIYAGQLGALTANFANYSTTGQMNTAISVAVAAIPASFVGQGSFNAEATAAQDLVFGAGGNQTGTVLYGTELFDPDACFAASEFTAPATGYYMITASAYCSVPAGTPTDVDTRFYITVAAGAVATLNDEAGPDATNGRGFVGATYQYLTAGQVVGVTYDVTVDAACTVRLTAGYLNQISGYRVR